MATKTNWQELYTDLSPALAGKLRDARIKPDKLKEMTDGEILSIQGLGESALEKIRTAYSITSVEQVEKPKKVEESDPKKKSSKEKDQAPKESSPKKPKKAISKRLQLLKKQVKPNTLYPLKEAIELLKKLTKGRKTNTVELHINTLDTGIKGEVSLPYSTGKKQVIEVFSEKTVTKLNTGKVGFDILLATPANMPKLAKYAKILGPKGLMPTPKNGNLIENPKKRLEELSTGSTLAYKTEPKFPIIHLSLGSSAQKTDHLTNNISALVKHINPVKIKSVFLTSTQTPSVKIDLAIKE
jgi:large subunit ribosomal protein L1